MVSSQIICTNKPLWLGWMVVIFQALVGCHDILILGKSPIKWRQRPDMTLAVDWDVKHQLKQTNKKRILNYYGVTPLVWSIAESYNQKSRCLVASCATVVQSFVCKSPI